jgi:(1->4)-alpha-D-glucan 1-alpha-D-glucosylmutase
MGQLLDVVPNHMGIVGNENVWWNDVLENGHSSPYASFFDIDWDPIKPELQEKVLLPILGDPYGKVLESGQISLSYKAGAFFAHYYDHRLPIAPETAHRVLGHRREELEKALGKEAAEWMEYGSILTALGHLPSRSDTEPARVAERQREKEVVKRRLATLVDSSPAVREFIRQNIALFNGKPGDPHSYDLLDDLLNEQAYRLAFWRVALDETNYRRFFDVNELAALSMERPEVFDATHVLILRLLREGKVTGLRIDHPDGLYDPRQYLDRLQQRYLLGQARNVFESDPAYRGQDWAALEGPLREAAARAQQQGPASPLWRPLYVVVEKILEQGEPLPEDWACYGTTGYEFLNDLNELFVDPDNVTLMTRIDQRWSDTDPSFAVVVFQRKYLILQVSLSSELHVLAHQLDRLSEKNRWSRDFTLTSLRHALREIIAWFPVYRSYISERGISERDHLYVHTAVSRARAQNPAISASVFNFVRDTLLRGPDAEGEPLTRQDRAEQLRFVGKFQQVTGPVMAKGLEDTAFYDYNRLISLNEVGGDPSRFGSSVAEFHTRNLERQVQHPLALSATSTHDTKRSEDVRARINVLSELPQQWRQALVRWNRINRRLRVEAEDLVAPSTNDEYLLYQTLVGAWPLDEGGEVYPQFVERIQQYMQKAIHESKAHTSWINPNPAYDDGVRQFVSGLLDPEGNSAFVDDCRTFQKRVSHFGLFNALSQTLLKITSPGVPDTYQGTELWDFSLVDPDNRRPVDYGRRCGMLRELRAEVERAGDGLPALAWQLVEGKEDGRIKLYVTWRGLQCRRERPGLFSTGDYEPAVIAGQLEQHVCAFVRRLDKGWAAVVAPRLFVSLLGGRGGLPMGQEVWGDAVLPLPGVRRGQLCRNVFTGEVLTPAGHAGQVGLPLAEVLGNFPVALLTAQDSR